MFGEHKKSYRAFQTILFCVLSFACGALFFGDDSQVAEEIKAEGVNWNGEIKPVYESGDVSLPQLPDEFQEDDETGESAITTSPALKNTSEGGIATELSGNYLILEKDENIVIYFIDEFGAKQFIQRTDIPYGLLSEGDQEMFRDGISLNSLTEVFELLQDFES